MSRYKEELAMHAVEEQTKLKESHYQATQDADPRKSTVQQIMRKSVDFWRRIIVQGEGQGVVTVSYVCARCHRCRRRRVTEARR